MKPAETSWSDLFERRRDIERRFGRVFALPIVRRVRVVLEPELAGAAHLLDVGAGDRRVAELLTAHAPQATYVSVDPDPGGGHDHETLDALGDAAFEVVVALEVAEHVPPEALRQWIADVASRVAPGGRLVLSTPNTWFPQEYLRDATHRTPLPYDQLGAMLEQTGLRVRTIHRVHPDPWLRRMLRRYVFGWLFRLLELDFARRIVVVADRDGAAS